MATIEISVPDIGDFKDVPVIELLVKPGDTVNKEDSLVTLESDKATMDVPSPHAGTVKALRVKVGDKVSQGTVIAELDVAPAQATSAAGAGRPTADVAPAPAGAQSTSAAGAARPTADVAPAQAGAQVAAVAPAQAGAQVAAVAPAQAGAQSPQSPTVRQQLASTLASLNADMHAEVLVLGAGPGGYTAAFRAADLGKKVVLVERYATLGGVCLNVGCIPSKALLHAAKVIAEAAEMSHFGVTFAAPKTDLDKLRAWKDSVVAKLTKGLSSLARGRKVTVVEGRAQFASAHSLEVQTKDGRKVIAFDHCIIAAGSQSARIPNFPYDDPRLMDSTSALELKDIPKRLLIIGGGIIGLEMATVYDALGSRVSVVEFMDRLIPGADPDIVKPLARRIEKRYEKIMLKTKVAKIEAVKEGLRATFENAEGGAAPAPETYDRVLLAVGRRPNGKNIAAEKAGVNVNERGWIPVDKQMRTNVPHIFAIGDIVGEPMLAHKATHEGKLAAEVIAGMSHHVWEARTIPSVAYTDPEVAWMGLSEPEAKAQGVEYEKAVFPWAASGRAIGVGREEGLTKLLFEKGTKRILGAAIVGVNAGELIAETVLALEMGADAEDIGLTIHPHPTLSETVFFGAEIAEGTITDMMPAKK
ncbi:MAG TPA: dihydrolipoyl dehydrogenase [Usitatibacter sp.]|nr:dihydrolipoyl dehydrogenase [Usitatibacter sp.]